MKTQSVFLKGLIIILSLPIHSNAGEADALKLEAGDKVLIKNYSRFFQSADPKQTDGVNHNLKLITGSTSDADLKFEVLEVRGQRVKIKVCSESGRCFGPWIHNSGLSMQKVASAQKETTRPKAPKVTVIPAKKQPSKGFDQQPKQIKGHEVVAADSKNANLIEPIKGAKVPPVLKTVTEEPKPLEFKPMDRTAPASKSDRDAWLQSELEKILREEGLNHLAQEKKLSVTLVDLYDKQRKSAQINGDLSQYGASMAKLVPLVSLAKRVCESGQDLPTSVKDDAARMMRGSSNVAASKMVRFGHSDLQDAFETHAKNMIDLGLFVPKSQGGTGGLMISKAFDGRVNGEFRDVWHKNPYDTHGGHALTTDKVAELFERFSKGTLVCQKGQELMRDVMCTSGVGNVNTSPYQDGRAGKDPMFNEVNDRLVKGLRQVRPDSTICRKTGTYAAKGTVGDAALIERSDAKYAVVVVCQAGPQCSGVHERLIKAIDQKMSRNEGLARAGSSYSTR